MCVGFLSFETLSNRSLCLAFGLQYNTIANIKPEMIISIGVIIKALSLFNFRYVRLLITVDSCFSL